MKSNFIKSTIILSVAALLSKVLGSIFRIPLQNIAGDEVLGIFTLVYPVYMVALTLSVAGIPIAISKLIAEARAEQDHEQIRSIFVTSGILASLFGVLSFLIIYLTSDQLAAVLGGPSTKFALIIVSTTLLIAPYMAVYRGFFQGHENMTPTAISQVIEQLIRVGIILAAAYYMVSQLYNDEEIAGGIMVGSFMGAAASLIYLRMLYNRSSFRTGKNYTYNLQKFKRTSKLILRISIPICVGAITMALLNLVDSVTIPTALRIYGSEQGEINYLYGIYGRGLALVQIVTVFATSIVLPLIPSISGYLSKKDHAGAERMVHHTYFMTHLIAWPSAIGLVALTYPINLALFTNIEGSGVLAVISLSSVFTALTVLGTGILQGMNQSKLAAYIILGGAGLKIVLNFLLVNVYGLAGAAVSTAIVYFVLFIVNTYFIKKYVSLDFISVKNVFMIASAVTMGIVIGVPSLLYSVSDWTRLTALIYVAAAIVAGAIIYVVLLFMSKVVNKNHLSKIPLVNRLNKR